MRYLLVILLGLTVPACLAEPLSAETMSAEAFDRYTRGKTLFFGRNGQVYGAERYKEDRRVTWTFLDGQCQEGIWYEDAAGQICFIYENNPDPQCWTFRQSASGLTALFEDNPEATELYEAQDLDQDMVCLGPEVGV